MSSPMPTNIPVAPTQQFNVKLQAQEWNMIIACMSKATYEQAAPMIQAISVQLQEQAAMAPNGLDTTSVMHPELMRYRKLDANRDMQFGHGAADFWKDTPEGVGQSVATRLLLYAGEWYLDTTNGTPWGGFPLNDLVVKQGRILAQHTQLTRDAAIRERIIQTKGVLTINTFGSAFDPNTRAYSVNATIDTIYGGPLALIIRPPAAPGAPAQIQFAMMPSRPPPPLLRALPQRR